LSVVGLLELHRRNVTVVLVQAAVIEPVDPFQGGDLDLLDGPPGATWLDQLGLVETGEQVARRIADAAHAPGPGCCWIDPRARGADWLWVEGAPKRDLCLHRGSMLVGGHLASDVVGADRI